MGTGFLEVVTITALGGLPIVGAKITVFSGDEILYSLVTNESGITEIVALEAPPKALTLDANFDGVPYSVCDVKAEAEGFVTVTIYDVEILDTETSILPIHMSPALEKGEAVDLYTPEHNLVSDDDRRMDVPPEVKIPTNTRVLSEVIIPEFITVHLGRPDREARNVRVPFTYYIKNCASHEIYSTWPPASLEANIYCIISLTLNRIFTEWYRVRGFNFDITNSTQFDQMFVEGGQIFQTIDRMVDQIFNRYLRRRGHLEPFFAEYCDGRRVTCPGLWQWGTVTLANQGRNALQILHHFYPNDIEIVETNNIGGVVESFPGFDLRPGMSGPAVRTMQTWLNRIRVNFPAIPPITNVSGIYGPQTEAAVRAFQSIRALGNLTPNGIVDRATWYRMSFTYSAVKRLGELTSEGIIMGIGRTPPTEIIREGARGRSVQQAQYLLNFISEFYPAVPGVLQNSLFTSDMTNAVREFQRRFGLNPDGATDIIGLNLHKN
ncbi:MAG: peptidoglycan-binding protein [Defluviitaleaceae bacterium]|nr:peptidoglycan-binding protein [Defluviitaleaceae bacterium]